MEKEVCLIALLADELLGMDHMKPDALITEGMSALGKDSREFSGIV